jgi:hypothetical protein|tara:strand:+ start:100 stop:291 length:192 start_codon:yes stop_codon:yes gene_type:complete
MIRIPEFDSVRRWSIAELIGQSEVGVRQARWQRLGLTRGYQYCGCQLFTRETLVQNLGFLPAV